MKRWIAGLLAMVLVLTLFTPTMLTAFAESNNQKGKVNYSAVYLRDNPWGTVLDLINQGTTVEVYGSKKDSDGNSWYEVQVNGKKGYMYAQYIDLENSGSSQEESLKGTVTVTWDFARVRTSPWGTILGQLSKGKSAEVVGRTKDRDGAYWYKVKFDGKEGYMHGENVSYSSSTSSTTTTDKSESTSSVKDESLKGSIKVTWDFARVRKTPWGTILGQLNYNQTAEVVGRTKDSDGAYWYKVKYNGQEGYMHEDNITFIKSSSASTNKDETISGYVTVTYTFARVRQTPWGTILGELSKNQTAEVLGKTKDSDGATWYKVKYNGKEGYMHAENLAYSAKKETVKDESLEGSITVTYSFARVRQTPWGTVLGQLNKGQSADVIGKTKDSDGATWYKVKYNGKEGYMHAENVAYSAKKETIKDESLNGSLTVTYSFARVRQTPWGTILGQLSKGQSAEVIGKTKDSDGATWYKVKYNGKEGYMHSENVALSKPLEVEKLTGNLKVTYTFARVRKTPWGTELGQLKKNETISVTGKTKDSSGDVWYEVDYKGSKGYMHSENVSYSKSSAEPSKPVSKGTLRINYSVLNVREQPTTSSKIVTTVTDLSVYSYTDEAKDSSGSIWYKIDKGWVHGSYVDLGQQKVTDLSLILSSLNYTGSPIEVSATAFGSNRVLYKFSIKEGSTYTVLSDFSEKNSAVFTPKSAGSYTIKVEAKDVKASSVEKVFEESFTLKENGSSNHTVTYAQYGSLEAFAKNQVGSAVRWKNGYWVEATYEEILAEMDPQNALTFDTPTSKPATVGKVVITGTVNARSGAGTHNSSYGLAYPGAEYQVYGESVYNGEVWYKIKYSGKDAWIHSDYAVDVNSGKTLPTQDLGNFVTVLANGTALRAQASSSSNTLVYLAAKNTYMILGKSGSWLKIQHNGQEGWVLSSQVMATEEVNMDMFMFLDLRSNTGISAEELNKVLKGKGILEGKGAAFVEASKLHDVNEIYLVSHALLETGNGKSALATGQVVNGVTVYNMYGIGAYDSNPVTLGAQTAYNEGWTTPEKAIINGAKWISSSYVHNDQGQYTLYKMRYNYLEPTHQYATDISWAKSQTSRIKELYGQVTGYSLRFEIPIYTDR